MNEYTGYKTTEYKVDKDNFSWLYDIVKKNAKDIGLDIEKEGIKVSFFIDSDNPSLKGYKNNAAMSYFSKTLYIGIDYPTRISERVKNPDNFDAALEGVIKHELQHYKDFKQGYYNDLFSIALQGPFAQYLLSDEISRFKKINECRADFVNIGNDGFIDYRQNNDSFYTGSTHPSGLDRMRSLMIQSHIKEKTKRESNPDGIILTPNDVEFNGKCEFSITNKDKLYAIPAEVLVEAYNKAERSVPKHRHVSLPEEEPAKVFSGLKPKAQQNWDARKGVGP